jgi:hypothetical protein
MKKILDIRHFIILALIVAVLFLDGDNRTVIKEVVKEIPGELVHDTITVSSPEYIQGSDIYHDTTIYVPTLVHVDTAEILKDFYAKMINMDTIKLNNNQGFLYLSDSISQNKIISREWSASIKPKIVRESAPPLPPIKNQMFIGVDGSWSQKDWVNSLGMGLILKTKKDHLYQVGVGVANRTTDGISGEFTPYINGGIYWKIKVKKD